MYFSMSFKFLYTLTFFNNFLNMPANSIYPKPKWIFDNSRKINEKFKYDIMHLHRK